MEREQDHIINLDVHIDQMAAEVLDGFDRTQKPHVLLGPVVWEPHPDTAGKRLWYFVVISGGADGGSRNDKLGSETADGGDEVQRIRDGLSLRLIAERTIVIHDFDDELEMARLAAVIWPSENNRRICETIERERGEAGHD